MRLLISSIFLSVFVLFISCSDNSKKSADESFNNLIPKPVSAVRASGYFQISSSIQIHIPANQPSLLALADGLVNLLKPFSSATVSIAEQEMAKPGINFQLVDDASLNDEEYELNITDSSILIKANKPEGVFYGIQTLRQLMPASAEEKNPKKENWLLAAGTIRDFPLYKLRGSMLDVSRHFFGLEDVKRYIDFLAAYKMNVFHMHLSDDQGWRIEIKKWPKLTKVGGSTQVGGGKGGFYTQEQYKEIVQYAAERFITVIPEIDMPGHTNAALASYPELNCNTKDTNPKLYTGTEVGFSTLCASNEKVYAFVEDVIKELAAITPGPYIHIGGDESHVTPENEYIRFINRVQAIVNKHGKKVMGWDEIAKTTLMPGTVAQHWNDSLNALKAVKQKASIVMSPAKRTYLDMQYDSTTRLGLNWASYIEVEQAYNWDPATLIPSIDQNQILGVVAPLWTETILTMKDIEYMVFPRLLCYAEIGWSPASNRNWMDYRGRLGFHGKYLKAKGINFYESKQIEWK
jgi:hexosaminidase